MGSANLVVGEALVLNDMHKSAPAVTGVFFCLGD